jgi:hypothetical protein
MSDIYVLRKYHVGPVNGIETKDSELEERFDVHYFSDCGMDATRELVEGLLDLGLGDGVLDILHVELEMAEDWAVVNESLSLKLNCKLSLLLERPEVGGEELTWEVVPGP